MPNHIINPKTAEKLASPAVPGTRHIAARAIALDLLGNGSSDMEVFGILRSKYPPDVSDGELSGIIRWARDKNPTPSLKRSNGHPVDCYKPKVRTPLQHANWWLSGRTIDLETFSNMSQLAIPDTGTEQMRLVLEMIYEGPEYLNIVVDYIEHEGKASPKGSGKILTRDGWLNYLSTEGFPQSNAGAWFRPNPCLENGSGTKGAVTDSDVSQYRFMLVESDVLPMEVQLMLFSVFKLPISMVLLSGGLSAHAWVRIGAKNAAEYSERTRRILSVLAPFGIDQANKNPSRLSRLPGAKRIIGANGDGMQRVLWLNPAKMDLTENDLELFEGSVEMPALEEKPFRRVIEEAINRYEELYRNRGNNGIPTGIVDFDNDTGGLKKGQMMVISAETGAGKSSVAINMANASLLKNKPVALFTLEMSTSEVADLLFSMNCKVNRNKFNTGEFTELDFKMMTEQTRMLSNFLFWSCDQVPMTVTQIRQRVFQLKREFNVELVIVDYAQIVNHSDPYTLREQQVADVARSLRTMAKESGVSLIVLSQVNDDGKLRESRVLGHEAQIVVSLENRESENKMMFHVVKGRFIRKKSYTLHYDPVHCFIKSASKIDDDDIPKSRASTPYP